MSQPASHIIEFYGETCPHCLTMKPVVAGIEQELGIEIQKLEVWNDEANQKVLEKYGDIVGEACGGYPAVPSFVNTQTGQALCGTHDAEDIKALIAGADCSGNVCKPHSKIPGK